MMIFAANISLLFGLLASVVPSDAVATPGIRSNADDRHLTSAVQGQVTKIQLIDANTDAVITELEDGMVISLDAIKSGMNGTSVALNVEALVNGTDVRSVRFGLNSNKYFKTESNAPFAMCGNSGPNYHSCGSRLGLGKHTITATPRNRNGQTGRPVTMTIEIVEADVTPPTLVSLKALTPTAVDVSNGDAQVVMQVVVQDDASGFSVGAVAIDRRFVFEILGEEPISLVDVRHNDFHAYNVTMRIKKYLANATFDLSVLLFDNVFNAARISAATLAERGMTSSITVVNTKTVDVTAPELISLRGLTPLTVSPGSTVDLELVVRDDFSGINYGYMYAFLTNTTEDIYDYQEFGKPGLILNDGLAYLGNGPELPAGVNHTFVVSFEFDAEKPVGEYAFYLVLFDGVMNTLEYNATRFASRGFANKVVLA